MCVVSVSEKQSTRKLVFQAGAKLLLLISMKLIFKNIDKLITVEIWGVLAITIFFYWILIFSIFAIFPQLWIFIFIYFCLPMHLLEKLNSYLKYVQVSKLMLQKTEHKLFCSDLIGQILIFVDRCVVVSSTTKQTTYENLNSSILIF